MKHTKGPWKYNGNCTVMDSDGSVLTCFVHSFVEHGDTEQDYANARLAAAAPEMLEALINIVKVFPKDFTHIRFKNDAVNAIEKATGLPIHEVLNG